MIIVAGFLMVHPADRDTYLSDCIEVTRAARSAHGCYDFHLSPDPVEAGRINIFERWESVEAVENFRGSGTSDDQQTAVIDAEVAQYEIASSTPLT